MMRSDRRAAAALILLCAAAFLTAGSCSLLGVLIACLGLRAGVEPAAGEPATTAPTSTRA
ncbi:hypothetical protein [Microbispora sp. CSR-4]|uniref:hypothetical protein n=1 Tax=Microbispora TaxID=2005 RepID=UPI0011CB86B9|nr:hypothetical protein [Microbispora sp. CSR-4]